MTNTKETFLFSHGSMRDAEELWFTFCTLSCVRYWRWWVASQLHLGKHRIFINLTLLTESGT